MAAVTKTTNFNVTPREIDFVTRFANSWQHLLDLLGITNAVEKQPGTVVKRKHASITLESGNVSEGSTIPYSVASVVEEPFTEMSLEKYSKAVSLESIKDYGYDVAIGMTDDALLNQLRAQIIGKFYTALGAGELTNIQTTFQAALAMANGLVMDKFKTMQKDAANIIGFVNTLDFFEYLGGAQITVQNEFGLNYIKNFMGYDTIFLASSADVARGTVIATPAGNLVDYYVNPANSDFERAGLGYVTDNVTNLIGVHTKGNYGTAVSEIFAIMGNVLFAEYVDGVAVVKVEASGSIGSCTITSAAGTSAGTKITVTGVTTAPGLRYFIKAATGTAPTAPTYKAAPDSTWKEISVVEGVADNVTGLTTGDKAVLVVTNGSGQAISASSSSGVAVVNHA